MEGNSVNRSLRVGARVRTRVRRGTGRVVAHHPTLAAWIVEFPKDRAFPLAWFADRLEVVG